MGRFSTKCAWTRQPSQMPIHERSHCRHQVFLNLLSRWSYREIAAQSTHTHTLNYLHTYLRCTKLYHLTILSFVHFPFGHPHKAAEHPLGLLVQPLSLIPLPNPLESSRPPLKKIFLLVIWFYSPSTWREDWPPTNPATPPPSESWKKWIPFHNPSLTLSSKMDWKLKSVSPMCCLAPRLIWSQTAAS